MKEYNYKCSCTQPYTAVRDDSGNRAFIKVSVNGKLLEKHDCICPYCRQRVQPKTIVEAKKATDNGESRKLRMAILSRKQNIAANPTDANASLALGLFFLLKGGYRDARTMFKKVIDLDPRNPNGYFYSCVSLLGGRNASLADPNRLKIIEERLNISESLAEDDKNRALYYYFHAYIKYDAYTKKHLATSPTYQDYLSQAMGCGLTRDDKNTLFEMLKVPMPSCL